jgi:2',3'-cyclic-nucleotide 2'-phosphodiesterase (5'-nucleotidase family)
MRRRRGMIALLSLAFLFIASASFSEELELVIVHTNDVHGYHTGNFKERWGATMRRAKGVEEMRRKAGAWFLLLDAGDIWRRGELAQFSGRPEIEVMNYMGYDAMAVGNNELYDGVKAAQELERMATFPFLSANVTRNGDPIFRPYCVKRVGYIRVGIIGVTTPYAFEMGMVEPGVKVEEPIQVVRGIVSGLKGKVDLVVVLSHLGIFQDMELARKVEGIDVIVGGHTHTFLEKPVLVRKKEGKGRLGGTVIVQAGEFGVKIGVLRIGFRRDERVGWVPVSYRGELVGIERFQGREEGVSRILERYVRR